MTKRYIGKQFLGFLKSLNTNLFSYADNVTELILHNIIFIELIYCAKNTLLFVS